MEEVKVLPPKGKKKISIHPGIITQDFGDKRIYYTDKSMHFEKVPFVGRIPRGRRVKKGDALHLGKDKNYRLATKNKSVDAIALESIGISRPNRWIEIDKVHPGDSFSLSSK